jgi:hypothetical protein
MGPNLKNKTKSKRIQGMAQVAECLLSKVKPWVQTPLPQKKKKKDKRITYPS